MNAELRDDIGELLRQTGQAHHKAFSATGGDDPDWSIWYTDHLRDAFAERFGMDFHRSQLIYCLMRADVEHQARSPDSDWPIFYANEIIEHYAASAGPSADKLMLYHFDGCPFCLMVRSAIEEIGIDVELRDVMLESQHRDDLIKARGRATVPVLRIKSANGEDRWMPESRDIISYLQKTYS